MSKQPDSELWNKYQYNSTIQNFNQVANSIQLKSQSNNYISNTTVRLQNNERILLTLVFKNKCCGLITIDNVNPQQLNLYCRLRNKNDQMFLDYIQDVYINLTILFEACPVNPIKLQNTEVIILDYNEFDKPILLISSEKGFIHNDNIELIISDNVRSALLPEKDYGKKNREIIEIPELNKTYEYNGIVERPTTDNFSPYEENMFIDFNYFNIRDGWRYTTNNDAIAYFIEKVCNLHSSNYYRKLHGGFDFNNLSNICIFIFIAIMILIIAIICIYIFKHKDTFIHNV
jgi:hypothetical protein